MRFSWLKYWIAYVVWQFVSNQSPVYKAKEVSCLQHETGDTFFWEFWFGSNIFGGEKILHDLKLPVVVE